MNIVIEKVHNNSILKHISIPYCAEKKTLIQKSTRFVSHDSDLADRDFSLEVTTELFSPIPAHISCLEAEAERGMVIPKIVSI